jgi:hypothetical protein
MLMPWPAQESAVPKPQEGRQEQAVGGAWVWMPWAPICPLLLTQSSGPQFAPEVANWGQRGLQWGLNERQRCHMQSLREGPGTARRMGRGRAGVRPTAKPTSCPRRSCLGLSTQS